MKWMRLIAGLTLVLSCFALPSFSQDSSQIHWIEESLTSMQKIKVGMERTDLERTFIVDGGISTPRRQMYVYRGCPYFKVDVEFEPNAANPGREHDKIVKISKPYLDWPRMD